MALVFDFYNSIITVPSPQTTLQIQDLLDEIRNVEDEYYSLGYGHIADAFGKQDLGGGVKVGITMVLQSPWRIAFEARPGPDTESCRIDGGNLVGGLNNNPIAPTAYTQVTMANSSSATISTPNDTANLKYLIESLYGSHMGVGNTYYWDPVDGSDTNDGLQPASAVKTFTKVNLLVTSNNHDIVYCLANDPSGITTVTDLVSITKNGVKIRGPGYSFQLVPTATTDPTININAHSVQISGLYVSTAATGSQNAITVAGANNQIKDSWITTARGHCISLSNTDHTQITNCLIENSGQSGTGDGLYLGNSCVQCSISKNVLTGNKNGINLTGTSLSNNTIENNLIYNNSLYGITVGSGVTRTTVRSANTITNNTSGNTQDLGTDTYIETPAGGASASDVADAVWDELIASHTISGSTGKTLKDAKTKATLASIQ